MAEPLKDELLSAYLDDALSAADRDRVARHLADNPEDRQLVNELRVLRQSLQSLPQHKLPAEFRDQVLRQAERAMLTQPVDASVASPAPRKPKWLPADGYRALAWPAAVVAVAIMLMVVYRGQPTKVRNVAQVAKPPAAARVDRGKRAVPELHSWDADKRASKVAAPARPKEDLLRRDDRSIAAKQPAEPPSELRRSAAPALAATNDGTLQGKTAVKAEGAAKRRSPASPDGSRSNQEALSEASHAANRYAGRKAGPPATRPPPADSLKAPILPADRPVAFQDRLGKGVLLVQVDVSRQAAKEHAFEKLLDSNRIVPQRQRQPQGIHQQQTMPYGQAKSTAPDRQVARSRGGLAGPPAKKPAGRAPAPPQRPGQDKTGSASGGDVEVFYAEATERQVQAALEDLKQRSGEFPAFVVQPDPSQPRQSQFAMFNRINESERWQRDRAFRGLANWKDQVRLNIGVQPPDKGHDLQQQGIAGGVAEEGGVDQRGGMATEPSSTAGAEPASVIKSEPASRSADDEKRSLGENDRLVEQRGAPTQLDAETGQKVQRQAVARSRDRGYGFAGTGQAGKQLQEAVEQPSTSQLPMQPAPAAAASLPGGQLDRTQIAAGGGARGRRSIGEEAAPLQIVFLLRVVGLKATPAADSKPNATPEPAAVKSTTAPKPN